VTNRQASAEVDQREDGDASQNQGEKNNNHSDGGEFWHRYLRYAD
jgi:hypothetical protein